MIRGRAHLQETDDEATTRAAIAAMLEEHVPDEAERAWIGPALLVAARARVGRRVAAALRGVADVLRAARGERRRS